MRICGKYPEEMSQKWRLCVKELQDRQVNMFTTVFIGNSGDKDHRRTSRLLKEDIIYGNGY